MFVNGHAEELRSSFARHRGKKELMIDITPDRVWTMDLGVFAQKMATLIHPDLEDWFIPRFSTTTNNDKSIAAIVVMGTVQEFFDCRLRGGCGFPSVTLLGEKSDWYDVEKRTTQLRHYGTFSSSSHYIPLSLSPPHLPKYLASCNTN
jgi:hypothetical protein